VHDIGKNIVGVVLGCNGYEVIDLGVMVPCDKILAAAREHGAQAIGLSGLITPSLEEMAHVAAEMERQGFDVPLMIGGATTSRAHTAIKIAPNYSHPVVYVPDASRAVGVVTSLLSETQREAYAAEVAADYEKVRAQHASKKGVPLVSLADARANRFRWNADASYTPQRPASPGIKVLKNVDLATLAEFIDWGPFFQTWDLAGAYPQILDDKVVGETARNVFRDGQEMLRHAIEGRWLQANAVFGLFPAAAEHDDILIYGDERRSEVIARWHGLRQQHQRPAGKPNYCISDFIADVESGVPDWVGMFAVTGGIGIEKKLAEFEAAHDDYRAIMLKAIADRFAEACAEWLHARVRTDYWAYAPEEVMDHESLIRESYRGIRPAPGYPACPDHTAKGEIFRVLDVPRNAGMALTEAYAMTPASAVCGFYLAHPDARYFAISKIADDQLQDWAGRAGFSEADARRWLAPIL